MRTGWRAVAVGILGAAAVGAGLRSASGNGGPFIVKYPSGDPAAKGTLARLDPDLKPGREERLRVVQEDLSIAFGSDAFRFVHDAPTPLVHVTAAYRIANPADEAVTVDFGFPILRGIYLNPMAMMPVPDVRVTLDAAHVQSSVISNSQIYKIIRCRSREAIDVALRGDAILASYVETIRGVPEADRAGRRSAIVNYMKGNRKWAERDAELLADYAALDCGWESVPVQASHRWFGLKMNLGALAPIGERKATQFLAHLAALLDPKSAPAYESLFAAWGGDVRERSIDLSTGAVRPREFQAAESAGKPSLDGFSLTDEFGTYARVDHLDPKQAASEAQRAACERILKLLPVTFTFAPMNLVHYQVTFPPKSEKTLTVAYKQHAYLDTAGPESYQIAYVVHPASLWKDFGPIRLTVQAPDGVAMKTSVACEKAGTEEKEIRRDGSGKPVRQAFATYRAEIVEKTGELFVGIDAAGWKRAMGIEAPPKPARAPANDQNAAAARRD
jgi:hypothetical protein